MTSPSTQVSLGVLVEGFVDKKKELSRAGQPVEGSECFRLPSKQVDMSRWYKERK